MVSTTKMIFLLRQSLIKMLGVRVVRAEIEHSMVVPPERLDHLSLFADTIHRAAAVVRIGEGRFPRKRIAASRSCSQMNAVAGANP